MYLSLWISLQHPGLRIYPATPHIAILSISSLAYYYSDYFCMVFLASLATLVTDIFLSHSLVALWLLTLLWRLSLSVCKLFSTRPHFLVSSITYSRFQLFGFSTFYCSRLSSARMVFMAFPCQYFSINSSSLFYLAI